MAASPLKSKRLIQLLAIALPLCAALLLGACFFVTSSFAVCGLWLPLASKLSGVSMRASSVELAPLRGRLGVKDLALDGGAWKLKAESIDLSAAFLKAVAGDYEVKSLKVSGADFVMKISEAKGAASERKAAAPAVRRPGEAASPSFLSALKFKAGALAFERCSARVEFEGRRKRAGIVQWAQISNLFANCDFIEKGRESHFSLACAVACDDGDELSVKASNLSVEAAFQPDLDFTPDKLSLRCLYSMLSGQLDGKRLDGSSLDLLCSLKDSGSKIEIQRLSLEESVKGQAASTLSVSGSLGKNPFSADLALDVSLLYSPLADYLADFAFDCDLSRAAVKYSGKLKYSQERVDSSGSLAVKDMRMVLARSSQGVSTTEALSAGFAHALAFDLRSSTLSAEELRLSLSHASSKLLELSSAKPFEVSWGKGIKFPSKAAEPELHVEISSLPLNILNPFVSGMKFDDSSTFTLSSVLKADASDSGVLANANLKFSADALALSKADSSPLLGKVDLLGELDAALSRDDSLALRSGSLTLKRSGVASATLDLSGAFAWKTGKGSAKTSLSLLNHMLLEALPLDKALLSKLDDSAKRLRPFSLNLKGGADFDLKSSEAVASSLEVSFATKSHGAVSVSLLKPLKVAWAAGASLEPVAASLQLKSLDLALADSFKNAGPPLRGLCDSALTLALDSKSGDASLKGFLSVDRLPVDLPGAEADSTKFRADIDAKLSAWSSVALDAFKLMAPKSDGDASAPLLEIAGAYDLKSSKGSMDIRSCRFDSAQLTRVALLANAPSNVRSCLDAMAPASFELKGFVEASVKESSAILKNLSASFSAKDSQSVDLKSETPLKLNWSKDLGSMQEGPAKFKLDVKGLKLAGLSPLLPKGGPSFTDGRLDLALSLSSEGLWRELRLDSELSLQRLAFVLDGKTFKGMEPFLKGPLVLRDYCKSFDTTGLQFGVQVDGDARLDAMLKGGLSFSGPSPSGRLGLQISKLDDVFLKRLPYPFAEGLSAFDANGRLVWTPAPKADAPSNLVCELKIPRFSSAKLKDAGKPIVFSGSVSANVDYSKEILAFKQCQLDVSGAGRRLADIGVSGQLRADPSKGPSSIALNSTAIDMKAIETLFSSVKPQTEKSQAKTPSSSSKNSKTAQALARKNAAAAEPEPAAITLNGWKGRVSFDLKKVSYGPELVCGLLGSVDVDAGRFSSNGLLLSVNGSAIDMNGTVDLSKPDGWEYSANISCKYLNFGSVAKAFGSGVKGELRDLSLPISGKGYAAKDLERNLKTHLQCKFSKLSIPYELDPPLFVKLIFFVPVDVVCNADKLLVGNQFDFSQVRRSFDDVKNMNRVISFQSGEVGVYAQSGLVTFAKVDFSGGDPMDSISMSGTANMETGALKVLTKAHTDRVIIPITIAGTIWDPSPDYVKTGLDLCKDNALNILNPENLTDGTAVDFTKRVLDVGKRLENFLGR